VKKGVLRIVFDHTEDSILVFHSRHIRKWWYLTVIVVVSMMQPTCYICQHIGIKAGPLISIIKLRPTTLV